MSIITKTTIALLLIISANLSAQTKIYTTNSFEFLFQNGQVTKDGVNPDQNMRFTLWLNYTHQKHVDFNKNLGIFTGVSIKNVGFITEKEIFKSTNDLGEKVESIPYETIKRRIYTLGIPLALKIGDVEKNFYVYGGGEIGLALAYKEKRFENSVKKSKTSFLGSETNLFQPSIFTGIQLPGGLNIQYRLFLNNMLKQDYGNGTEYDQSGFSKSLIQYISICFNLGSKDWKKYGITYSNKTNEIKSM
jgi:hypothetical protein